MSAAGSMVEAPRGTIRVLIADPAWRYQQWSEAKHGAADAAYEDGTMATDDICRIPVKKWLAKDAVLFVWGTWPKVPDCLRVLEAWGADEIVSGFPWVKTTPSAGTIYTGIGFWTQSASEYLLIGRRGRGLERADGDKVVGLATDARGADEQGRPRVGCGLRGADMLPCGAYLSRGRYLCMACVEGAEKNDRVLWAPRAEHSRKPEEVHEWVERLFPGEGPETRLELFARRPRPGWTCWGGDLGFILTPGGSGVRRAKVDEARREEHGSAPWGKT